MRRILMFPSFNRYDNEGLRNLGRTPVRRYGRRGEEKGGIRFERYSIMRACICYILKGNMDEKKFRRTYLRDLLGCQGPPDRLFWLNPRLRGVHPGIYNIDSLRTSLPLLLPFLLFFPPPLFFIALRLYLEKNSRKHKDR